MAATLKVDDATKAALDRLQATVTLKAGKKPTLQDLLQELVTLGWAEQDALAKKFAGWVPLDEGQAQVVLARLGRAHPKDDHAPSAEDRSIYEERP